MGIRDSFRRRFDVPLESHQIDEDYTPSDLTRSHSSSALASPGASFHQRRSSSQPTYPSEEVPSYEDSQLHHLGQPSRLEPRLEPSSSSSSQNSVANVPSVQPRNFQHLKQTERTNKIKQLGLKFLNARQHTALALCRDISLCPPLVGLFQSWRRVFVGFPTLEESILHSSLTSARVSEHFLTGVWCIVSAYLTYAVIDGLLVRWIVTYSTSAAIVRVLSMSVLLIASEQYLVSTFTADGYKYGLHIWILISCSFTLLYIGQNFITSNIDVKGKKRRRFFDFYKIVVFAVVPVGLASFLTMIVLLRSLLILRIDIDGLSIRSA